MAVSYAQYALGYLAVPAKKILEATPDDESLKIALAYVNYYTDNIRKGQKWLKENNDYEVVEEGKTTVKPGFAKRLLADCAEVLINRIFLADNAPLNESVSIAARRSWCKKADVKLDLLVDSWAIAEESFGLAATEYNY